jgi:hypothetical protein
VSRSVGDLSLRPPSGGGSGRGFEYAQPRSLEKREADRRRLIEEKDLLSSVERHLSVEEERRRVARDEYKRQLQ